MLMEALVVISCVQQKGGCSESTSAYYQSNKDAQAIVQKVEDFGKKIVNNNEWLVYAATPMYAVASGETAHFHVYRGWILGINVKKETVLIQWSY